MTWIGKHMKPVLILAMWIAPIVLSAKELKNVSIPISHDLSLSTHQKLGREYCVSYGNPQAEIEVVEYFSLSCPECIKLLKQDFPSLKEKYVHSGKVFWTLHPDPADILTLQMMECLGKLSEKEKKVFFEALISRMPERPSKKIIYWMQATLAEWERAIPQLQELEFLEKTAAFRAAYKYVRQENAPKEIPTVEINGELKETFPTYAYIDKTLSDLLKENSTHSSQKKIPEDTFSKLEHNNTSSIPLLEETSFLIRNQKIQNQALTNLGVLR